MQNMISLAKSLFFRVKSIKWYLFHLAGCIINVILGLNDCGIMAEQNLEYWAISKYESKASVAKRKYRRLEIKFWRTSVQISSEIDLFSS